MIIKDLRKKAGYTQAQAAEFVGMPLRTYVRYEADELCCSDIKREYIVNKLTDLTEITETKGILKLNDIKSYLKEFCEKYRINYCCVFGSYAKGTPTEKSDVDILVDTDITGLKFYGLVEEIRTDLCKKVDLLRVEDVMKNKDLLTDILKEGIKIYG